MALSRSTTMLATLLGLIGPASAATLPIEGAFGNEAGCRFYMTGEAAPDMEVLTGDTVTGRDSGCDFTRLVATTEDRFEIEAVCSGAAATHVGMDRVVVRNGGETGYFVQIQDAAELGPLSACPGSTILMSPGVRI